MGKEDKVITSHIYPGLKFPATKKGWKDLMIGKDSGDSLTRAFTSLLVAGGIPAYLSMFGLISSKPSPETTAFIATGFGATIVQAGIAVKRASKENELSKAQKEKERQEKIDMLSQKITKEVSPIARDLLRSNIQENEDGITVRHLYSGNPLSETNVVDAYMSVRGTEANVREIAFVANEQINRTSDQEGNIRYAYRKPRSIHFLYNESDDSGIVYNDDGMSNWRKDELEELIFIDTVLTELKLSDTITQHGS